MNISEIFIRRPIATSLLMAGIALIGVISYTGLPVSDLPAVDYPTVQVQASLPGGDPATMALHRRQPARAPVHDDRRRGRDDVEQQRRQHQHHALLRPRSQHRQRRRRRPDRDRGGHASPAVHAHLAAVVPQAEPGRPADPDAQPHVEHAVDGRGRRVRRERAGAAHLHRRGRVAGAGAGRAEVRRARPARSRPDAMRRRWG